MPEIERVTESPQGAVKLKKKSVALNGYLYKERGIEEGEPIRALRDHVSADNIKETIKGNPHSTLQTSASAQPSAQRSPTSQMTQAPSSEPSASVKTSAQRSPTSQMTQAQAHQAQRSAQPSSDETDDTFLITLYQRSPSIRADHVQHSERRHTHSPPPPDHTAQEVYL